MNIHIKLDSTGLISGANAANKGASSIRAAINRKGSAQIILATGTSQFAMLEALAANHDLDWSKCSVFHLDEYIGLSQQNDVPLDAITMSITQIMKSRTIICTVDGARKADAVLVSIEGPLDVRSPASILRKHSDVWLFLDRLAGSKLNRSAFNN